MNLSQACLLFLPSVLLFAAPQEQEKTKPSRTISVTGKELNKSPAELAKERAAREKRKVELEALKRQEATRLSKKYAEEKAKREAQQPKLLSLQISGSKHATPKEERPVDVKPDLQKGGISDLELKSILNKHILKEKHLDNSFVDTTYYSNFIEVRNGVVVFEVKCIDRHRRSWIRTYSIPMRDVKIESRIFSEDHFKYQWYGCGETVYLKSTNGKTISYQDKSLDDGKENDELANECWDLDFKPNSGAVLQALLSYQAGLK